MKIMPVTSMDNLNFIVLPVREGVKLNEFLTPVTKWIEHVQKQIDTRTAARYVGYLLDNGPLYSKNDHALTDRVDKTIFESATILLENRLASGDIEYLSRFGWSPVFAQVVSYSDNGSERIAIITGIPVIEESDDDLFTKGVIPLLDNTGSALDDPDKNEALYEHIHSLVHSREGVTHFTIESMSDFESIEEYRIIEERPDHQDRITDIFDLLSDLYVGPNSIFADFTDMMTPRDGLEIEYEQGREIRVAAYAFGEAFKAAEPNLIPITSDLGSVPHSSLSTQIIMSSVSLKSIIEDSIKEGLTILPETDPEDNAEEND